MSEESDVLPLRVRNAGNLTNIPNGPSPNGTQLTSLSPDQRTQSTLKAKTQRRLSEYTCFIDCAELGIHFTASLPPDFDWSLEAAYDAPFKDVVSDAVSSVSTIATGLARASGISMVTQALTAKFWNGSSSGAISLPLILQAETDEVEEVLKPLLDLSSLVMPRLAGNKTGSVLEAPGPYIDLVGAATRVAKDLTPTVTKVAGQTASTVSNKSFGETLGKLVSAGSNLANTISSDLPGALRATREGVESAVGYVDDLVRSNIRNRISLQIGNYMRFDNVVITSVSQKHLVQVVGKGYGVGSDTAHGGNMQRVELSVTFEPFFDLTQQDLANMFLDPRAREYIKELIERGVRK